MKVKLEWKNISQVMKKRLIKIILPSEIIIWFVLI